MSGILQKGARRFTTQIGAAGVSDAISTTIPLVSVTGLPTDTQIELVIDRTDASGNLTPAKEEVVRGTVSGTNLINCVRGVEGTAQAHSAGATVNSFLTASMWNNIIEYTRDFPARGLINGKIVPTVASNNLTVAIKTLQDTDPSPSNPVYVWIDNTLRTITSALSTTNNAGTNWLNMGSAELATREVDLFVYISWNIVGNNPVIGVARIPFGRRFDSFVASGFDEKGVIRGGNLTGTANSDPYVNVGRFAATLSAGASHNWSVPTFTNANLIQEPIYETRLLTYVPTIYGSGGSIGAFTANPYEGQYQIINRRVRNLVKVKITNKGSWSGSIYSRLPINSVAGEIFLDMPITGFLTAQGANPVTAGRGFPVINSNVSSYQFLEGVDTGAITWASVQVNDHIRINGHYYI